VPLFDSSCSVISDVTPGCIWCLEKRLRLTTRWTGSTTRINTELSAKGLASALVVEPPVTTSRYLEQLLLPRALAKALGCSYCLFARLLAFLAVGEREMIMKANQMSDMVGRTSMRARWCPAGQHGPDNSICAPCPSGTYKSMDGQQSPCTPCPANTDSPTGSTNISACLCIQDFIEQEDGACVACPGGAYKNGLGPGECVMSELAMQETLISDWLISESRKRPFCIPGARLPRCRWARAVGLEGRKTESRERGLGKIGPSDDCAAIFWQTLSRTR